MCVKYKRIGTAVICAGVIVILGLVLPASFWWFLLGVALICIGFKIRKCKKSR